jgi:hypothetical protein
MRKLGCFLVLGLLASPVVADTPSKLTSQQLDSLVQQEFSQAKADLVSDNNYLRRVSLDLIGRPPTPQELNDFLNSKDAKKRAKTIERLLASKEYGQHWADYWCDTIRYQVPPPELTFLSYEWFKPWLAEKFNTGVTWDKITQEILTGTGNVKEKPAATFVGYHQGNSTKLAAETARIFLGLQIQCAQCHDHKFDHWKREQFHSLAAFFARSSGKLGKAQDGSSTMVGDAGKGEHVMPDAKNPKNKGKTMEPVFLTGTKVSATASDTERRQKLAKMIACADNPWFATSYVNRMWAQLTRRGFYEPVDNMADYQDHALPKVHQALASHFAATGFDTKDLFRLIMNSQAYQRDVSLGQAMVDQTKTVHNKLNGDQVFRSLVVALEIPNVRGEAMKPTAAIRFPPPPKSTQEIVADKFGYDPSYCPEEISRTLGQAMQLMNNEQIQAQVNADPASKTLLSRILQAESDNRKAFTRLFQHVLARNPSDQEITIALDHINEVNNRSEAFEDILWGLINSAEFTTKR